MTTKLKTDCKTKGLCHYEAATRTNFFNGMLLTDDALRAEQTYHRNALKRLNRYMWGSGIVCGFEVAGPANGGLCIAVQPGFALDCHGNAIESCKCITIDLGQVCKEASPDGCAPPEAGTIKKCLVVRYAEVAADPQPVLTADDECDGTSEKPKCLPSKYREGFCFELRDECPPLSTCADQQGESDGLIAAMWQVAGLRGEEARAELEKKRPYAGRGPACPSCACGCDCDDCTVCLANLTIDCKTNSVEVAAACRSHLWGPNLFRWLVCGLFARVDRLAATRSAQGVPSAEEIAANPVTAAWDVGALAVGAFGAIQEHVTELNRRIAKLEAAQGGKSRTKE